MRYTIGQLARACGVPTTTVRYYERRRLLSPRGRDTSNYRTYDDESLERLRFIRAAQGAGFTLDDVVALFHLVDAASAPCREVQGLIEERLAEVDRRLRDLRSVRDRLAEHLRACRASEPEGRCQVIDGLRVGRARSASGATRA
jgi:DNA-binding transcriptional MerR regulator